MPPEVPALRCAHGDIAVALIDQREFPLRVGDSFREYLPDVDLAGLAVHHVDARHRLPRDAVDHTTNDGPPRGGILALREHAGRQESKAAHANEGHSVLLSHSRNDLAPENLANVRVLAEYDADRLWNVLVQLDTRHGYAAEIGTIRSRASSAAQASVAATASFGNVG